ncbi:sensor diguanylate cyclase/phosphodiesterase, PAS domain-containing [Syntrophotalea carbinolica DSM 2380]|uniref:Sensor diguanylate cyclase/phosphodiesterase, PAS domain-containing n=1 Tax=Syntrophotalea carbinolica (strain DSM 2380 / NBRC 103641 / GraBd1) TaxID=338963 RepID=Q3A2X0_SYNC1|nr:sensor diguanylate cyclase/phosphodiesterase, PAS domain-containing [Syntrophotalea carbinolica DSM 2380]
MPSNTKSFAFRLRHHRATLLVLSPLFLCVVMAPRYYSVALTAGFTFLIAAFCVAMGRYTITAQKLHESEKLFRTFADFIYDWELWISAEGSLIHTSPACERISGYATTAFKNDSDLLRRIIHPEDLQRYDRCENEATPGFREFRMIRRDGQLRWVELLSRQLRNEEGKDLGRRLTIRDITGKKAREHEIRQIAYSDALTGLPNRLALKMDMDKALAKASRNTAMVAVLMLDLDDFKQINDTTGHAKGDEMLLLLTSRLREQLGEKDSLARLGGDEFVVVLNEIDSATCAAKKTEKILASLRDNPFDLVVAKVFASASIGIALFPQNGRDAETLLKHADMAMYEAKNVGRNTYRFFSDELHRRTIERHKLEVGLRRAVRKKEFFLVYQPQVDLGTGRIVALEALVRWQHPEAGVLLPSTFIPVAEETGLIHIMGEWILRTACHQAMQWQRMGLPPMRIAVNFSARQFRQPDLVERIEQILLESGLPPHHLELEITESVFMENLESAIETLVDLKTRAIQIAIDDFGTGYSSLNYLKNFPLDRLKIAQDFVRDIPDDEDDATIIETIMAMANRLGIKVLAEGVETMEQVTFLRRKGCHEMQGFYFARPMQAEEIAGFLNQRGEHDLATPLPTAGPTFGNTVDPAC